LPQSTSKQKTTTANNVLDTESQVAQQLITFINTKWHKLGTFVIVRYKNKTIHKIGGDTESANLHNC